MRKLLIVLAFTLLWLATFAQPTLRFVVNNQTCASGQCTVNVADLSQGSLFHIGLLSPRFPAADLEFSLSLQGASGYNTRNTQLFFNGHVVHPREGLLAVPKSYVAKLLNGSEHLSLSIGGGMPAGSELTISAFRHGTSEAIASLTIHFHGLKTPGEQTPWPDESFYSHLTPTQIAIYPNPVKNSSIFIDLRSIAQGRSGTVSIIDLLGESIYTRRVVSGRIEQCPTDQLQKGVYFIRVEIDGIILHTGRLIVDK